VFYGVATDQSENIPVEGQWTDTKELGKDAEKPTNEKHLMECMKDEIDSFQNNKNMTEIRVLDV
jgi:hypothetical protein